MCLCVHCIILSFGRPGFCSSSSTSSLCRAPADGELLWAPDLRISGYSSAGTASPGAGPRKVTLSLHSGDTTSRSVGDLVPFCLSFLISEKGMRAPSHQVPLVIREDKALSQRNAAHCPCCQGLVFLTTVTPGLDAALGRDNVDVGDSCKKRDSETGKESFSLASMCAPRGLAQALQWRGRHIFRATAERLRSLSCSTDSSKGHSSDWEEKELLVIFPHTSPF